MEYRHLLPPAVGCMAIMALLSCFAGCKNNGAAGNATDSIAADSAAAADCSGVVDGHRVVDLALPSGTLWAETNVGAESPADAGNYYAWGETETKDVYVWGNSKLYGEGDRSNNGLTAEEDAATAVWGKAFCIPSREDFNELHSECSWTWTSKADSKGNAVAGYEVKGSNGNSIFLPASGSRSRSDVYDQGTAGYYWSRNAADNDEQACYLYFSSSEIDAEACDGRYNGYAVRPVSLRSDE